MNCLIDIMLKAGLIVESDGKYVYNQEFDSTEASTRDVSATLDEPGITKPLETQTQVEQIVSESRVAPDPSVHINVQIHIDANATPEQIDQIFASMAKHLYGRS
ncbi:MAG: hypothetical protein K6T99_11210 [Armatimonadetes bacterium]|nr:hypothetical protein [Armatimonadota bacterium]